MINCCGQSYDNARNMSVLNSGVQEGTKIINSLTEYIPCAAHSFSLVGTYAASSVTGAVDLCFALQEL